MEVRGRSQSLGPLARAVQRSCVSIRLVCRSYLTQKIGAHTNGDPGLDGSEKLEDGRLQ